MCQTVAGFLGRSGMHLDVLTLLPDPLFPLEIPLDGQTQNDGRFRENLSDTFEGQRFLDKVNLLRLLFVCHLCHRTDLDEETMAKVGSISEGLLPNWMTQESLELGVTTERNWQVDSVEKINLTIWGSRSVPFRFKYPSRKATL